MQNARVDAHLQQLRERGFAWIRGLADHERAQTPMRWSRRGVPPMAWPRRASWEISRSRNAGGVVGEAFHPPPRPAVAGVQHPEQPPAATRRRTLWVA